MLPQHFLLGRTVDCPIAFEPHVGLVAFEAPTLLVQNMLLLCMPSRPTHY